VSASLISVIGPPASGKTTLAEALAVELPARLIREDWSGNPFIADAYTAGGSRVELASQLYFLLSRVGQLARDHWPPGGMVVSDYGFCQDRLYARTRLSSSDFDIYRRLAEPLTAMVQPPDVMIVLEVSPAELRRRIATRGRAFERSMTDAFLATMAEAYADRCLTGSRATIRVDGDRVDLRLPARRAELIDEIRQACDAS
jgi:deoxyadenosine/deoxycytidine kinase